jgi:hypothetical protein
MLTVLANGLVGSASDLIQKASTALVQGTQSYPLTFPVQFPTIPTFVAASMNPPSNSGEVFIATVLANSITNTGCTVILSGIPSAASVGGTVSVLAAQ